MADDEGLDWLPRRGIRLTRDELADVLRALRAIISGTDEDEPNRVHAVTIAMALGAAFEREGGHA
ncbi:MAG TPA: hypothetical protein VI916_15215, partial [Acidimicrobiia bacterium]|nr:hypothetical protein [Acidimicrobiia bacterium]